MKIFLYKFVIILIGLFLIFELTLGSLIKDFKREYVNLLSKEKIESIKSKARQEMRTAINKDVYLDPEDAKLISRFIKKIQNELNIEESK